MNATIDSSEEDAKVSMDIMCSDGLQMECHPSNQDSKNDMYTNVFNALLFY